VALTGFLKNRRQHTLKQRVSLSGVGVHSGKPVSISICPAGQGTGIAFRRIAADGASEVDIPARSQVVGATELCTVLGEPGGICVATVEHLLAALVAMGVDNAIVEIDGPEVPVMDGSAIAFVNAIEEAALEIQTAPRRFIKVKKPVRVELGSAFAEFRPHDGTRYEIAIDYECSVIGRQAIAFNLSRKSFRREIARARTFGYMRDVERLRTAGFALGSSLENSVAIGDDGILNPDGLRYPDEFVRHKALDAIGDLALAGAPILGCYRSFKGGHKLNQMALSALFADRNAWSFVSAETVRERRSTGRAELPAGMPVPAYAPEV
jgi:UDP-3-O-[3-hydroxymyristoyl] N-acetylglucosamine deacetylase